MTCRQLRSLIDAYLDGELDPIVAEDVRAHLKSCRVCREEYRGNQRLLELLRHMPDPEPPAGYWDDVTRIILARTVELDSRSKPRGARIAHGKDRTLMPAVLSVVLSLGLLFVALYIGYQGTESVAEVANRQAAQLNDVGWLAGAGEAEKVTIADRADIRRGLMMMSPPGPLSRTDIVNGLPPF